MKRKKWRRYVRRTEDKLEEMERKIRHLEDAVFYIVPGMEVLSQQENCCEANTIQAVGGCLKTVRTMDIVELYMVLIDKYTQR